VFFNSDSLIMTALGTRPPTVAAYPWAKDGVVDVRRERKREKTGQPADPFSPGLLVRKCEAKVPSRARETGFSSFDLPAGQTMPSARPEGAPASTMAKDVRRDWTAAATLPAAC
jgi:hypothetical protein